MSGRVIGVLGGSGAVGRVAVDRLSRYGLGPLRVGGRDLGRARAVADGAPGGAAEAVRVDLGDPGSLAAYCEGCSIVVNCAGPSYQVLDTVARAALAAGADYVDAAGDAVALRALASDPPAALARRSAVFSAGLMPGLSGLLPRVLAESGPLERLDVYVGGAAAIGPLSAVDALLTRGPGFGSALAAWRGGRVVERALAPLRSVALPGFRGRVHAWPFLSAEAADLAAELGVGELRNYTVYVSEHIPEALARAWAADDLPVEEHVPSVVAAADADIAIGGPWYTLLFHARPRVRGGGAPTRLLLRTPDSYALSGVVAALAARALAEGAVPAGAHAASAVLDPRGVLDALSRDPLVDEVDLG
ncbi:saccharopine dehydrogenase NADP-binding domain-containing protein [Actinorugispora endophytica]|uniref:Saccharopine dehydrogenase-like protein n=1 Tax=Actinorugispora endophytica TaxID=1605990 RepID=A0A4R6UT01_9ACTN|nr:saccharopine dehydrogenase NADP-binding domain-containing protein [Actinorugispora endophytica]TDQ50271.1 saccharopine dehydrogenase-like protein [Actinorugispora endophytica]